MITRIALIPAYQPEEKLGDVTEKLHKAGFEIIVVDDGSGREYWDIFGGLEGVRKVLMYEVNRGKGYALKTGLDYIRKMYEGSEYVVVTLDADGQHLVKDAEKVCQKAEQHPDRLIIGERSFEGDVPLRSMIGNSLTRFIFSKITGMSLTDTQTGLRAFSGQLIEEAAAIPGDRYEYEMNELLHFASEGQRILSEHIRTVYIGDNESSHFDAVRDSFRIYMEIFRFALRKKQLSA